MIKYFYIRVPVVQGYPDSRGRPIDCVAYQRTPDPDVHGNDIVTYAISQANPKDEFRKDIARRIASQRLLVGRRTLDGFSVPTESSSMQVLRDLVGFVAMTDGVTERVGKAAVDWLQATGEEF